MTEPFQARIARDLVVVSGPDATSFLQSLVSQDLDGVAVGAAVPTLLLQPQGKLLVDFYALRAHDDLWSCLCEAGFGSALAEGLRRFKIRVKADIEEMPTTALAVRGLAMLPAAPNLHVVPVVWRGDGQAFDIFGTAAAVDAFSATLDLPLVDADAYERARIVAGVPRLGYDIDERTIPQEAGLERDAVSFTKGCFIGQELVCRIDTRGHVNRRLVRLRAENGELVRGAEVTNYGRGVGEVTSSAGDVALAMLRREVEPGTQVHAGDASARVEDLYVD
jgi:folate-binding protein YgfZ